MVTTSSSSNDMITLTAPDGFQIYISDVTIGHPNSNGPMPVVYAEPITFLGEKAYIDYYSTGLSVNKSSLIYGGTLSKSTIYVFDLFSTRNIRNGWITINIYNAKGRPFDLNTIKQNGNYKITKLIIQSMHY